MTNRSLIVVRFVVPLGLILLTGCTTVLSNTLTGKEVAPSTSLTSEKTTEINNDSSVPSSQSPVATLNLTPSPAAKSRSQLTLASIHMMTTTTGWAEGWTLDRAITSIFRTSDGGLQWQDVSPPDVPANSINITYFLDSLNAWLVASPFVTPAMAMIYHTADGGKTWQTGSPLSIQKGAPALLGFLDPQYGWLMVNLSEEHRGTEAVEIFETDDGGLHWAEVSLTSSQPNQSTPGSLPLACDKAGLAFSDISTGWVTGYCPGQAPLFYVTHDEGHTWQKVALPDPEDPTKPLSSCDCEPGPPVFSSAENGFFALRGNFTPDQNAFLYVTTDGGQTWHPRPLPLAYPVGKPDFTNANDGWVWATEPAAAGSSASQDGILYRTRDGGRGWVGLDADRQLRTALQDGDSVADVDFVTEQTGWLVVIAPDGTSQLFKTTDGGHTWSVINLQLK